ncbi:hypothetical protein [Aeromonas hydrophila]|uniref:hypothetical protein n=1 Tax=Aeromonas hydrophila TaxID=644 RepID=UPI0020A09A48|nr:hypothetical protein [Aeromonas hydrophila]MCP1268862.1 hypothetical protein [Aeromonas hydrophila]MCP1297413.1 hypothetical protein [Aeromonas hydrophila]
MPDSYNWLQLTKDILIPLSSTLVGAGVAYIVAKRGSDSQRKLLEQERELTVLSRIYHLLQGFEWSCMQCRDTFNKYCSDESMSVDDLRYEIISSDLKFDVREFERLIELNFRCFSYELSNNKATFTKLFLATCMGNREGKNEVNLSYENLGLGIRSMMKNVAKRSEETRGVLT